MHYSASGRRGPGCLLRSCSIDVEVDELRRRHSDYQRRIGVKFKNDAQRLSASKTTLCDRLVPECEACIVDDHTDDTDAEERLVCLRWPNGVRCVNCGSAEVVERQRHRRLRMWRCGCGKDFSVTTGTALHLIEIAAVCVGNAARSPDDSSSGLLALLGVSAVTARRVSRVLRSVPAPPSDARVAALLSAPKTPSTMLMIRSRRVLSRIESSCLRCA